MLVSAILVAILFAGGYALYLWLKQQRGVGQAPPPSASQSRSLGTERDRNVQPIELTSLKKKDRPADPLASLPGGSAQYSRDSREPSREPASSASASTSGGRDRDHGPRAHAATVPEMTAAIGEAVLRSRQKTQPEVILQQPAQQRRVRRRDPTMQISADELATITIDDEGTTLGFEVKKDPPRQRVSMQSEFDLSIEVALPSDHDDDASGPFFPVTVTAAGASDVGKKRKHNEDAIALDHERSVYVLADGMGGYAAGEVASQMCVDTILRSYQTNRFGGEPIPGLPPRGDELVRAIQTANLEILTESRANESRAGMGTTVVAVRFIPARQRAYIAHVGDSRLYRMRKDELVQMTADHTLGAQGVTGPAAQKLSRAVGVFDEVEVDLNIDVPEPGDVYLICSDGLFKMVHELRIVEILAEKPDPQAAANALVAEANARGGKDNISVIVLRIGDFGLRRNLN
jgi:protein phosphatase